MNQGKISPFITCNKRINRPSIHIKVCINKCEYKDECPDFQKYCQLVIVPEASKTSEEEKTA